jgi:hypothetical protein
MNFDEPTFEPDDTTIKGAVELVEAQAALLISVATGGPRIERVESTYRERDAMLRTALRRWGVKMPFPWRSLWDWQGFWSGKFAHYFERRAYIRGLADKAIGDLEANQVGGVIETADTGKRVESVAARLEEVKARLATAQTLDDFQDLGRRAREILIAAVDEVFHPDMVPFDEQQPKKADAKARFDLILDALFVGSARAETRNFMRAAWDLAMKTTHAGSVKRLAACRQDTVGAVQGAVSVVKILSELTNSSSA